jgi:hypothetical protein
MSLPYDVLDYTLDRFDKQGELLECQVTCKHWYIAAQISLYRRPSLHNIDSYIYDVTDE